MTELEEYRGKIDAIDRALVELFLQRMEVTGAVGAWKREHGVPVLDARSAFLFRRVFDPMFSADGIHPSVEGHRKMYEFLLPQMRRILGAPSAAAC